MDNISQSFTGQDRSSIIMNFSLPTKESKLSQQSNDNYLTTSKSKLKPCFTCSCCNLDFFNEQQFNTHVQSQEHQQTENIQLLQTATFDYSSAQEAILLSQMQSNKLLNHELLCSKILHQYPAHFLGLNHIIEFQFNKPTESAQYLCKLCQCKCSSTDSLIVHLTNTEHQFQFLRKHHPDLHELIQLPSLKPPSQLLLLEKCIEHAKTRYDGSDQIDLHIQYESSHGQKPVVIAIKYRRYLNDTYQLFKPHSIQFESKTFQDYDYQYDNRFFDTKNRQSSLYSVTQNQTTSIQDGLSAEDLLYPFDRQYWYDHYKDLLQSRPSDPHALIYQETLMATTNLQPVSHVSEKETTPNVMSPVMRLVNGTCSMNDDDQTIRPNPSQLSSRRVIFDSNRTSIIIPNGPSKFSHATSDSCSLVDDEEKQNDDAPAVLNEKAARAILVANGLLRADEENGQSEKSQTHFSSMTIKNGSVNNSEESVSPAIAKRMLEAVLTGDLDVAHIQPFFSTFVNLIRSGKVELERHQAEQLLHKVLVTSSPSSSDETDLYCKRGHTASHSTEPTKISLTSAGQYTDQYEYERAFSQEMESATPTRRVHLVGERYSRRRHRLFE